MRIERVRESARRLFTKKNILTVPNLLSLLRLCMIPLIFWFYQVRRSGIGTVAVIALSGGTDVLDGRIARKFGQVSDLGKILDPIADKLTQAAMLLCLTSRFRQMWVLIGLLAFKEIMQTIYGYLVLTRQGNVNSAKWYGKASTVTLYTTLAALILFPTMPNALAECLIGISAVMMALSLVLYSRFYLRELTGERYTEVLMKIFRVIGLLFWAALIVLCIVFRDRITVDQILNYVPKKPLLAALFLMLLFAFKSLTVVLYSGILYAVSGILFPLPTAVAVNLCGTAVMVMVGYWMGRKMGSGVADRFRARYPKLEVLEKMRRGNDFSFSFLLRLNKLINYDIGNMYLGAVRMRPVPYLMGSVLGILPDTVVFPIMGMSLKNIHVPQFWIALGVEVLLTVLSVLIMRKQGKEAA